jgi:predicted homoserine dehydrogenase-like protein
MRKNKTMLMKRLQELESKNEDINIGVVGAGRMGTGLIVQIGKMKGLSVRAVSDIYLEKATSALQIMRSERKLITTSNIDEAETAISDGSIVVTPNSSILPQLSELDLIVDATGSPEVGAEIAQESIRQGKSVVMLNAEADATIGPILNHYASTCGVVYTGASGDEPGATKELYDFATTLGFRVIAAGKGKNNPLDRTATPGSLETIARQKGLDPKMLTSFVDGTKTMVEMTQLANATGLKPDIRGMHGPETTVDRISHVFCTKKNGGILETEGAVDFALGSVAPGVFVVFTMTESIIRSDLEYLGLGQGPNYHLYRPYHLCHIETPLCIARAVIHKEPAIAPIAGPVADVITIAKRDLNLGERLDGIGGSTVFGLIERAETARQINALPIGLTSNAVLKRNVLKGEVIRMDAVDIPDTQLTRLRREQDRRFG